MNEEAIKREYIERPDEQVNLLCSYTTRREGFLDILLSKTILSSEETKRLLGKVETHRGSSMTIGGMETICDANYEIGFSTGFVSFKYSDVSIRRREDYVGGLGILVPLGRILEHPNLGFDHCSDKGGIKDYKLNKENIHEAVHKARRMGELYDDGFGNVFEVGMRSKFDENMSSGFFKKVIQYSRLELNGDDFVAIPESEQDSIIDAVQKRQEEYEQFLNKIDKEDSEQLLFKQIDGRNIFFAEESIPFMKKLTEPFKIEDLPIIWYSQKNLDIALQYLAISG